jgi:hypothetical protein
VGEEEDAVVVAAVEAVADVAEAEEAVEDAGRKTWPGFGGLKRLLYPKYFLNKISAAAVPKP